MSGEYRAIPMSGEQHAIEHGELRAVIASVGASLRELRFGARDLVVPFEADELRPNSRGVTVAPWPNRIADGRYRFDGVDHQLPINEVARGNALHGFTPWLGFERVDDGAAAGASDGGRGVSGAGGGSGPGASGPGTSGLGASGLGSSVVLRATVEPQRGYPWRVRVETRFALDEHGLEQTVTATNLSATAAPYGVCPHPYLVGGPGALDDWTLTLPAAEVLLVSEPRLLPDRLEPVQHDAERFDFREPRPIGGARLDHAFMALDRDGSGRARVELRDPAGVGVAMSWGPECGWAQVFTFPGDAGRGIRPGLAVEPMSCAPDAFNGGPERGLVRLEPGASHTASWRIDPLG